MVRGAAKATAQAKAQQKLAKQKMKVRENGSLGMEKCPKHVGRGEAWILKASLVRFDQSVVTCAAHAPAWQEISDGGTQLSCG